jgi:Leucine-rich repeat (LRR) protein
MKVLPEKELLLTVLVLWCLVINTRATTACISAERDVLVSFNASIKDPNGRLSSWQGENCCNWNGVRCSKTGHVVQLDLGGYALEGEINPSLAGLTYLVCLNLSKSDFGGMNIPEFIGSFNMLRYLDLSGASFGGTIPPQLGNLTRLRYLDLSDSHITVSNFHWVSKLTSLRYLNLSWLYLAASSDWLQAMNMLPKLEVIHLNDACLPVTNLNYLPHINFTTLKILNLNSNNLSSSLPNWLWNLSSVSELDLSGCGLYGEIPDELRKLTSLKFLALTDNQLKGEIPQPAPASSLCNLVHLDLSRNLLSGYIAKVAKNLSPCMKRLQILKLSDNKLKGNLSGWLEQMTSLRVLDLSKNSISGEVPASMGKLSNLTQLDISFNSLEGTLSELHFVNLSRLDTLVLSSNSLKISMKHGWMPPFQLKELGMHACTVGPQFPAWLQSQTRIEMIDLGSAGISGLLPDWIWNFSSTITSLNVSSNNISGKLPAGMAHSKMLTLIMRHNQLEGSFPDLPASLQVLDLSHNYLSGSLPQSFRGNVLHYFLLSNNFLSGVIPTDLCNMVRMEVVDLSSNNLSGVLPDCWKKNSNLRVIDFSSNKFWGEIPSTLGSLNSLITLHLGKNDISGTLPTSFQSLNGLVLLDLGENNLSGNIPKWIGVGLQSLQFLSLRSNQFSGEIPEELFQLHALQFLDFGNNKLSGPVPHSIGNLTGYLGDPSQMSDESPFIEFKVYGVGGAYFSVYIDELQGTWKGETQRFSRILALLNIIDLSQNQLTGEIPSGLGLLTKLRMLNLSRNCIEGSIPGELGRLTVLESLDLSWNNLSGPIPQSLTSLISLNDLNLSYNDLSGQIPLQGQFQTFTKDSYLGNVNLCGFSLPRICLPNSNSSNSSRKHRRLKLHPHFDMVTYLFMLLGFAFGLSTVLLILISSASARKAYIQFTDSMHDRLHLHAPVEMKLRLLLVWNRLRSVVLNASVEDSSLWHWSASQQHSSAMSYRAFFHRQPSILGAKELWKTKAPPRVKYFFWLAISGRCWTSDRLQQHNFRSSGPCALCDQETETIEHLVLGCVYSRDLWSRLLNPHGLLALVPHPDSELAHWWLASRKRVPKPQRRSFDSLVLLVAWSLWKERNRRVFQHEAVQPVGLLRLVGAEGAEWMLAGNSGSLLFLGGALA